MSENSETKKYAMALDPIHVGTGGYKLGRVDNTIIREPGTNVPKIPGSTINGAARTYSYYHLKENGRDPRKSCGSGKETKVIKEENGEKKEKKIPPCGNCEICKTYGHAEDEEGNSKRSQVNFSDARILLFPVHSMKGPVWITCPSVLEDCPDAERISVDDEKIKTKIIEEKKKLNLGWLYLENQSKEKVNLDKIDIDDKINNRIVLVSNKVFSQVINSNLEVRTSVSIDPETGAAEKGALFTYEAIPRGTVFWFDITYNKFEDEEDDVEKTVENGLKKFETLGVGGMTSRGLGRLKVFESNDKEDDNNGE